MRCASSATPPASCTCWTPPRCTTPALARSPLRRRWPRHGRTAARSAVRSATGRTNPARSRSPLRGAEGTRLDRVPDCAVRGCHSPPQGLSGGHAERLDMQSNEATSVLKNITYRPGWTFDAMSYADMPEDYRELTRDAL